LDGSNQMFSSRRKCGNVFCLRSFQNCLIINSGAFVCLIYMASGSVVQRSLSLFTALSHH
ncbi:hypothetical protein T4A_782, partial [Trichinella pseudospiralis]